MWRTARVRVMEADLVSSDIIIYHFQTIATHGRSWNYMGLAIAFKFWLPNDCCSSRQTDEGLPINAFRMRNTTEFKNIFRNLNYPG